MVMLDIETMRPAVVGEQQPAAKLIANTTGLGTNRGLFHFCSRPAADYSFCDKVSGFA